jgi:hypothetical protein
MVFSRGKLPRNLTFSLNGEKVEIVNSLNYLGIELSMVTSWTLKKERDVNIPLDVHHCYMERILTYTHYKKYKILYHYIYLQLYYTYYHSCYLRVTCTKDHLSKLCDKMNPKTYRPITILSCLGKLFTAVLSKRLTKYSNDFF